MRTAVRHSPFSASAWRNPFAPLMRIIANRRTLHALAALDDRQLADIGLSRLDVEWADTLPSAADVASELNRAVRRRVRPGQPEDA